MDFSEVAAVSGKGGLFRVVSPTRTGVILETMDGTNKKMIANMQSKVSILSDISIYTTDEEGAVPLEQVMKKIHKEFKGDTGLSSGSDGDELKSFLKFILPEYDESRVYVSDIKKLVTWYNAIAEKLPELLEDNQEEKVDEKASKGEKVEAKAEAKPKKTAKKSTGKEE
ncbi:MAG: DUF5606 domain-containing protein [Marinoscillum sp.]